MQYLVTFLLLLLPSACSFDQGGNEQSLAILSEPKFDAQRDVLDLMDRKIAPCQDFWRYACGGFIASSQNQNTSYAIDYNDMRNIKVLREIFDKPWPVIGPFYESCTDTTVIKEKGIAPLMEALAPLDQVSDLPGLLSFVSKMHRLKTDVFFSFKVSPSFTEPKRNLFVLQEPTLSLALDLYQKSENAAFEVKRKQVFEKYRALLKRTLILLDDKTTDPAALVALETQLALAFKAQRPGTIGVLGLPGMNNAVAKYPMFKLDNYWNGLFSPENPEALARVQTEQLIQIGGEYIVGLARILSNTPITVLKAYIKVRFILDHKRDLQLGLDLEDAITKEDILQESFKFVSSDDEESAKIRDRYCETLTEKLLWKILDLYYFSYVIDKETLEAARTFLDVFQQTFSSRVENTKEFSWLDEQSRLVVFEKINALVKNLPSEDNWPAYQAPDLKSTEFFKNLLLVNESNTVVNLSELGKPVNRNAFSNALPGFHTWNAYYQPLLNSITVLPSLLLFPMFGEEFPSAVNYGRLGWIVGHEIVHGFDSRGRAYDSKGNFKVGGRQLNSQWTPKATAAFEERAKCVSDYYPTLPMRTNQFRTLTLKDSATGVSKDVGVDGKKTLGENIADMGGLSLAFHAYRNVIGTKGPAASGVDSLTNDQLFFISAAQTFCQSTDQNGLIRTIQIDTHSPAEVRIRGAMSQTPEFAQAFSCKEGSPYHPTATCALW